MEQLKESEIAEFAVKMNIHPEVRDKKSVAVYQYELTFSNFTQVIKLTSIQVLVWNYVKVDTNRQVKIEGR